ncbi:hypothetical protein JCM10449v2_003545 [Rhodotorula kratochvilovae]
MTTPEVHCCLVCGENTKNRCSSCAKAGIDLFFCSEEHQKLVWKTHREVCGPAAVDCVAPPLSAEERDRVRTVFDDIGALVAGVSFGVHSIGGMRDIPGDALLEILLSTVDDVDGDYSADVRQGCIMAARDVLGVSHSADPQHPDLRKLKSPWELAGLLECHFTTLELRPRTQLEHIPGALRHRILVFATLAFQPDGRTILPPAPAASRPFLLHAFKQMVLGAADLIPLASVEDAYQLADTFSARSGRLLQGTMSVHWAQTTKNMVDLRIVGVR